MKKEQGKIRVTKRYKYLWGDYNNRYCVLLSSAKDGYDWKHHLISILLCLGIGIGFGIAVGAIIDLMIR